MRHATTADRTLAAYADLVPADRHERTVAAAAALDGLRVVHVNTTDSGGGVAEMLRSLVPLSTDAGVASDWLVLEAPPEFYRTTKRLHNGLQGGDVPLTDEMRETYRSVTDENAAAVPDEYDVVVLHDPQTLGMVDRLRERLPEARIVWRCHIDLTDASEAYVEFLRPFVDRVDRAVFSREAYGSVIEGVPKSVVHPAIDPLSPKNSPLDDDEATELRADLPPLFDRGPLLAQVSRFDPWKDPVGVVETYRRVADDHPDATLVLVGAMAADDPEAAEVYESVRAEADGDPGVHLLTDQSDRVINCIQRGADVVLQKSLREGFALTVSEALWKRTPVVGANVGGIPLQVVDGETGYLVDPADYDAVAERIRRLLDDPRRARSMGERGREVVTERFLLPRLLDDYLDLFADLTDATGSR